METFNKIIQLLRSAPIWVRCVAAIVAALIVLVFSSACGQTVKVTVRDTPTGVSISTNQNKADSSSTNIKIDPTINLYAKEK